MKIYEKEYNLSESAEEKYEKFLVRIQHFDKELQEDILLQFSILLDMTLEENITLKVLDVSHIRENIDILISSREETYFPKYKEVKKSKPSYIPEDKKYIPGKNYEYINHISKVLEKNKLVSLTGGTSDTGNTYLQKNIKKKKKKKKFTFPGQVPTYEEALQNFADKIISNQHKKDIIQDKYGKFYPFYSHKVGNNEYYNFVKHYENKFNEFQPDLSEKDLIEIADLTSNIFKMFKNVKTITAKTAVKLIVEKPSLTGYPMTFEDYSTKISKTKQYYSEPLKFYNTKDIYKFFEHVKNKEVYMYLIRIFNPPQYLRFEKIYILDLIVI